MEFRRKDLFVNNLGIESTIPVRLYLLLLSVFIAGGLLFSAYTATYTYYWLDQTKVIMLVLGTFVVAIIGILISSKSDNWFISLFGFMLTSGAMGLMIGPMLHRYTNASIMRIGIITMALTVVLGICGAIYPKSLQSWGGFLFTGLTMLIVSRFAILLLPMFGFESDTAMKALDWVGVVLFCGYIFYDMNQALERPHTIDGAVDSAVALYLDIMNLFVHLLSAAGDSDSSD